MAKPKRKPNSVRTSEEMASLASSVMRDKRFGSDAKSLAASALSNRRPKNK